MLFVHIEFRFNCRLDISNPIAIVNHFEFYVFIIIITFIVYMDVKFNPELTVSNVLLIMSHFKKNFAKKH